MGLLKWEASILHFDENYFTQRNLLKRQLEEIDVRDISGVNLICDKDSLLKIKQRLNKRKQRGITFIGSGNYHYVTYLILQEIQHPFTLVLFDNHPDIGAFHHSERYPLTCGTWVSNALLDIPLLQKVVIIGPTGQFHKKITHNKITIFPFEQLARYSYSSIIASIPTKNIYLSIDKDVLSADDAFTNWDHGKMTIETLLKYVKMLLSNKEIEGIDICGEAKVSPSDMLHYKYKQQIKKNETCNLQILTTCLQYFKHESQGA